MSLTELKGPTMARWLERALGWPEGYLDSKDLSNVDLKNHPLYKLLKEKDNELKETA
jgi:hypothetical protein